MTIIHTIKDTILALENGDISSYELTESCLTRIESLESLVHAFITLTPELAFSSAKEADKQWAKWRKNKKESHAPLLGVPIAVKDLLTLKDIRCTCGSRILENFIPPYTATSIQNLLTAGIVPIGKTNTDEFAMGSSTENSAYGTTHNPWDLKRVPGGSSGGSAAAVAARMVPGAIGTDTGGSVRQPAAFCGVTGIKPTYGRISRYGLIAYGSSLDSVGALAHTAEDAALLFTQMAGHDPKDATSMDYPLQNIDLSEKSNLKGLRIGVPNEYFIEGMQLEVEQQVKSAIGILEKLGAEISEISLPHTEYALPVYYLIAPAEASANLARYDGVRFGYREQSDSIIEMFKKSRGQGFGQEVERRIMLGTYALSAGYYDAYYGQAQKVRTLIKNDFDDAFKTIDIIAAPITPSTAFRIGQHTDDPLAMYLQDVFSLPANLAGVPGISFPVGFDKEGLPIGMQIMGPHFNEEILFKCAHVFQLATDYHLKDPAIA